MNFLYVEGSSYSDQLKISRWFSSGFPASPLGPDAVLPPGLAWPVDVDPQALSSIRPPSPSADLRDIGCPAARSTLRWSASILALVSTGARMRSWSDWSRLSLMVVTSGVGLRGCLRQGVVGRSGR